MMIRFGDLGLDAARPALYISQADIEAELRRRLRDLGVDVEWGTALVDLTQDDGGVTAALADDTTVRCGWLAGCDGAHSAVRKLTGIGFPGVRITEQFLLADVHADWPTDRAGGHGWPHEDGPLFAMPMRDVGRADDLWRLMAYDPTGATPAGEKEILERFRRLVPERTGRNDIRIRDAVWTSVFRAHRRLADTYRDGRVFLVGDAATSTARSVDRAWSPGWATPRTSRGSSPSSSVDADEALLDTYEAERRPLATDVLRGTTTSTRLQVSDSPLMRFIRRRVLVPIVNLPSFQRKASQIASKLWVSYRRGPLGGGVMSRLGRRPRPGDRVPDLTCVRADGSQTRLHAEVGRQWSLLTPAGGADDHLAEAQKRLDDHVVALTDDERRDIWLRCSAVPPVSSTSRATTFGCDDIDNLSTTALDQMSDAAAHATITLAQSTELINGKRGKATSGRSSPSSRRPGR